MIWVIVVLIPIGLSIAAVGTVLLLCFNTIVRFRRRRGITQPVMWCDRVPYDPASPILHGGRSVAALKTRASVMGSKGVARAVARKSQAQDAPASAGS